MRIASLAVVVAVLALPSVRAAADPIAVRMASMAPEGTAWARELKAYAREIEALTHGELRLKRYLGGIAGDESAVPDRIRKGQLDGEMAGGDVRADGAVVARRCASPGSFVAATKPTTSSIGCVPSSRASSARTASRCSASTWFGSDILFTRTPVRTMDDLRKLRLWIWNLDDVWTAEMALLGLHVVPLPVDAAGRAYDEGKIDGLMALPSAALVYQWSARTRYFTDLPIAAMAGCNFVSTSVFDSLSMSAQAAVRHASAKLNLRVSEANGALEDALIGGLFEKQGVKRQVASEQLRVIFFDTAKEARERLPSDVVPAALITQVMGWLSDYRASHR